jgi:hypothetical protein
VWAIPFLPRWWRGAATIVAAPAPVWILLATQLSYVHAKAVLPAMMRADGITVSKERAVVLTYLVMFMAIGLLPVVAIRLWRVARRTAADPETLRRPARQNLTKSAAAR